jgi:putative copper export protein
VPVVQSALTALAGFLLYAGLTLALGAVTVRYLLLPRSGLAVAERAPALRDSAKYGLAGAAAMLVAAPLRALAQLLALADPGDAWGPLLRTIISETSLGRALQLQTIWAAAALMAFSVARLGPQRGWSASAITTLVLALVPALAGHAAAADRVVPAQVAVVMHVLGAGAWIGTLFHLWRIARKASDATFTRALAAFHTIALGAAAMLALSGAYHIWTILESPSQLATTLWGRLLLTKLALLGGVVWLGYRNWKGAELQLSTGGRAALRRSMQRELLLALAVLVVTGVLTNTGTD